MDDLPTSGVVNIREDQYSQLGVHGSVVPNKRKKPTQKTKIKTQERIADACKTAITHSASMNLSIT